MKTWIKFLVLLIPVIASTIYLFWRFSPEQAVIRRSDLIFACLEKSTLNTGTPSKKAERFQELLSPSLKIQAPHPVDSGEIDPDHAARMLKDFLNSILSCTVSRERESVNFPTEGHAIYQAAISVEISQGPGRRYNMRYLCHIEFKRSGRHWLAEDIVLNPR